jgi:hypothetical protein
MRRSLSHTDGHLKTALCLVCLLALSALPAETQGQRRTKSGYLKAGSIGTRAGVGAFLLQGTERTDEGALVRDTSLGLSLLGGLSYSIHPRLSLDFDLETLFGFIPDMELIQLETTPGARVFLMPKLYGRTAYALRLLAPTNKVLTLGGGYYLSRGSLSVYVEMNFVVHSEKEVETPVIPRAGLEVSF